MIVGIQQKTIILTTTQIWVLIGIFQPNMEPAEREPLKRAIGINYTEIFDTEALECGILILLETNMEPHISYTLHS